MTLHDVTKMAEFYHDPAAEVSKAEAHLFFALANRVYPSTRVIRYPTPVNNLIGRFRERFSVSDENFFSAERYFIKDREFNFQHATAMVRPDLMVEFLSDRSAPLVVVLFSHETDRTLLAEVCEMLKGEVKERTKQARIGLLTTDRMGISLTNFPVEETKLDLGACYNDDFLPVHEAILSKLSESRSNGMVLLHGQPGTGKTTYLRHLSSILQKQLIFIPYEIACHIASPDFLSFMLDNRESVMILEDAEKLLRTREDGDNLNVANLLNISDGLLSDALHVQLICTFNTDITRLDKALLRKGRIIARYEFKPLSTEKSSRLAGTLGYEGKIDRPMTLAEIFNMEDKDYAVKKGKIGF